MERAENPLELVEITVETVGNPGKKTPAAQFAVGVKIKLCQSKVKGRGEIFRGNIS